MEHSPLFLKLRLVTFFFTTLISLIWVILVSCVLFLRWDVSTSPERSFLYAFLGVDTLTVIMLPVLLLVKFRTWLDGARLLLLLVCHIGLAASFVIWNTTNPCPDDTPDDRGVCQLINVYLIMASWVPPLLLILYGVGLATYTWRYARMSQGPLSGGDEMGRAQLSSQSEPVAQPTDYYSSGQLSYLLASESLPSSSSSSSSSAPDSRRESARKSRLEKRLPEHFF